MEKAELKGKIFEVMKGRQLVSLATLTDDGKPWVRYVTTTGTEDLTLYVNTFAQSRKVAQIKANPNVHVILGARPDEMNHPYLNIVATGEVLVDDETKKKFWFDELKNYFSGTDDPNRVILKITPQVVEYMGPGMMQPDVYQVE